MWISTSATKRHWKRQAAWVAAALTVEPGSQHRQERNDPPTALEQKKKSPVPASCRAAATDGHRRAVYRMAVSRKLNSCGGENKRHASNRETIFLPVNCGRMTSSNAGRGATWSGWLWEELNWIEKLDLNWDKGLVDFFFFQALLLPRRSWRQLSISFDCL